jgi:hypothetical protein
MSRLGLTSTPTLDGERRGRRGRVVGAVVAMGTGPGRLRGPAGAGGPLGSVFRFESLVRWCRRGGRVVGTVGASYGRVGFRIGSIEGARRTVVTIVSAVRSDRRDIGSSCGGSPGQSGGGTPAPVRVGGRLSPVSRVADWRFRGRRSDGQLRSDRIRSISTTAQAWNRHARRRHQPPSGQHRIRSARRGRYRMVLPCSKPLAGSQLGVD